MMNMNMKKLREFLIIIVVISIIGIPGICECCIDSDRNGLLQIKSNYLNPNYSSSLSSWGTLNADCCDWERVYCNSTTGYVTTLDLSHIKERDSGVNWYLNASLFLPFQQLNQLYLQENNIAGCIHNEGFERLSTLTNLEILSLNSNKFNNSVLHSLRGLRFLKSLDLTDNKLNGTINISELNNLTSTLRELDLTYNDIEGFETTQGSERLSTLTNLEILSLSSNRFNNSILHSLSGLPSLKSLYLSYNKLHAAVNISVKLKNLKYLDLSYNGFRGPFNFKELDGLPHLQELDLSNNQITNFILSKEINKLEILDLSDNQFNHTTINSLQSIGKMTSLKTLLLTRSGLSGNIPTSQGLCNLKHLQHLDMGYNDLNGNLPRCLSNLTSLQYLDLSHNQFNGKILSSPFQSLTSLQSLDISHNVFQISISLAPLFNLSQLTELYADNNTIYADTEDHNLNPKFQLEGLSLQGYGEGGSLPKFLYHQRSLRSLYIISIKLRGEFPYWLLENNTRLSILYLTNTSLSGPIRLPIHPHVSLSYLDISDNFLSGYIPSHIGVYIPSLSLLVMSRNELKGRIPDSLCNLTALYFLDISQNNLYGEIPKCFGVISQLQLLDLSSNNISGNLPSNFTPTFLRVVNLSKNRLHGSLKDAFYSSSYLFQLDLSHNNFSGRIPSWIGELSELSFLVLGYNNLQGEIPIELCKLKQLSFIDLSHNSIVGRMLPCLNFTSFWSRKQSIIGQAEFIEDIEITVKGRTYTYEEKILSYISEIDISSNYLTGQIPDEIGELRSIKALNLSHNALTGSIPLTFSNLKEIESLDLSHNNLQGTMPPELTQLTSLTVFNVSYNNLSGKTPNQVKQFATFDNSSYRGNPFLCGWPLSKSCSTPNSPPSNATSLPYDDKSNKFIDIEAFYSSFGVAYGMVLLTLVAVLCINPYWRGVWFYYVHMSIDKTYYFIVDNVIPLYSRF